MSILGITRSVVQDTNSTVEAKIKEQVISLKLCGKKARFLALDELNQKRRA